MRFLPNSTYNNCLERAPGGFLISAPFWGGGFFEGGLSRGGGAFKMFAPKGQNFLRTTLEICVFRPMFTVKMTLFRL